MTNWTQPLDLEARDAELRLRRGVRTSLGEWARLALAPQGLVPARHHLLLMEALEAVSAGSVDRLMVLMPPGSAKSTYASLLFPPWFLSRHPRAQVIAVSHTAGLAEGFGRGVRGLVTEHGARLGYRLDPASRAAGRFGTSRGGSYFATGVRGPVTGRRADLLLIDDPVKGQAEADSARVRDATWDWYRSDLVTRLRPGGRIVLVMTRWHPDDLGGRLLEAGGQWGESWRVLRLPALAEPGDPMGRQPGEALWPEWEGVAALERRRLALGDRAFSALYQQAPVRAGSGLFQVGRVAVSDQTLAGPAVRAWDLAATEGGGDWTVGVRLVAGEGAWQVSDVVRLQGGPEAVVAAIRRTAEADGLGVPIGLPQDPGQAGRAQVGYLAGRLAGWRVVSGPETGAKMVRAMPVASQANAGNLTLLRGGWNRAFLEELAAFPAGPVRRPGGRAEPGVRDAAGRCRAGSGGAGGLGAEVGWAASMPWGEVIRRRACTVLRSGPSRFPPGSATGLWRPDRAGRRPGGPGRRRSRRWPA